MARSHRWPDGLAVALLAAALLAFAVPRAIVEIALLPHHATIEGMEDQAPLSVDQVARLKQSLLQWGSVAPSPRVESLIARTALRRFETQDAHEALLRSARLGPGNSATWTRLAFILPPGTKSAHALRLSALTSAFEYDATPRRVDLGIRLWPFMDTDDKQAFGRLVHALWQWETGRLAMIAARREGYDQIAPYLVDSPQDWEHFTRSYAIHRLRPEEPYLHGP